MVDEVRLVGQGGVVSSWVGCVSPSWSTQFQKSPEKNVVSKLNFASKKNSNHSFELPQHPMTQPCKAAKQFEEWVSTWLFPDFVGENPKILKIKQAMFMLTERYRVFRRNVPKAHSQHNSDRGHICIFNIWDQNYEKLEKIEARLEGPLLFEPKPTPPKPRGTLIGLEIEDEAWES